MLTAETSTKKAGEMKKIKEGVCCECQNIHPVVAKGFDPQDERSDAERLLDGAETEFVMAHHPAFGVHCSGSGTEPQVLVKEVA